MKKTLWLTILLITLIDIAVAQPATVSNDQENNNRLHVEIISYYYDHFHHPQHPATGTMCPLGNFFWFMTSSSYSWYQWETSLPCYDDFWDNDIFPVDAIMNGYIKVTVGDNYGQTGTDSIWFNVKDPVSPLGNFIMEIGDDQYPTFSGIATREHSKIILYSGFRPGEIIWQKNLPIYPGEWIYKGNETHYQQDSLWIFYIRLYDTCQLISLNFKVPGLLLSTRQQEYNTWYLDMKTILQIDNNHYQEFTCVYFIYSIDQYGNRHHFQDENGNPIILPSETTSWQIPGPHIDPYYQCGVAKVLEDGGYELLSLSNKVPNPLYYNILHIDEIEESHDYQYCVNEDNFLGTILYGKADCQEQT